MRKLMVSADGLGEATAGIASKMFSNMDAVSKGASSGVAMLAKAQDEEDKLEATSNVFNGAAMPDIREIVSGKVILPGDDVDEPEDDDAEDSKIGKGRGKGKKGSRGKTSNAWCPDLQRNKYEREVKQAVKTLKGMMTSQLTAARKTLSSAQAEPQLKLELWKEMCSLQHRLEIGDAVLGGDGAKLSDALSEASVRASMSLRGEGDAGSLAGRTDDSRDLDDVLRGKLARMNSKFASMTCIDEYQGRAMSLRDKFQNQVELEMTWKAHQPDTDLYWELKGEIEFAKTDLANALSTAKTLAKQNSKEQKNTRKPKKAGAASELKGRVSKKPVNLFDKVSDMKLIEMYQVEELQGRAPADLYAVPWVLESIDILHTGAESVADDKLDVEELRGSHQDEWDDMRRTWATNSMKVSHGRISSWFEEQPLRSAWLRAITSIVPKGSLFAPSSADQKSCMKLCQALQPGMFIEVKGHEGIKFEVNHLGSFRRLQRGSRDLIFSRRTRSRTM